MNTNIINFDWKIANYNQKIEVKANNEKYN
jgi:hypothetical protein